VLLESIVIHHEHEVTIVAIRRFCESLPHIYMDAFRYLVDQSLNSVIFAGAAAHQYEVVGPIKSTSVFHIVADLHGLTADSDFSRKSFGPRW
jgi:hypothetical protein